MKGGEAFRCYEYPCKLQERSLCLGSDPDAMRLECRCELFGGELAGVLVDLHDHTRVGLLDLGLDRCEGSFARGNRVEHLLRVAEVNLSEVGVATGAGDVVADIVSDLLKHAGDVLCGEAEILDGLGDPLLVGLAVDDVLRAFAGHDVFLGTEFDELADEFRAILAEDRVGHVILDSLLERDAFLAAVRRLVLLDSRGNGEEEWEASDVGLDAFHINGIQCLFQRRLERRSI